MGAAPVLSGIVEGNMELSVAEKLGASIENPPQNGAAETVVVSRGKDYRVSYLEQRIKAQVEQWLVRNAVQSIVDCEAMATKDDLTFAAEADKQRQIFAKNRSTGKYKWMGQFCREALTDVPGTVYFVYLLLSRCHKDITEEEAYQAYMGNRKDFNEAIFWALGKEVALVGGAESKEKA